MCMYLTFYDPSVENQLMETIFCIKTEGEKSCTNVPCAGIKYVLSEPSLVSCNLGKVQASGAKYH